MLLLNWHGCLKEAAKKKRQWKLILSALRLMEQINDKEGIAVAYERISDGLTRQGRMDGSNGLRQEINRNV